MQSSRLAVQRKTCSPKLQTKSHNHTFTQTPGPNTSRDPRRSHPDPRDTRKRRQASSQPRPPRHRGTARRRAGAPRREPDRPPPPLSGAHGGGGGPKDLEAHEIHQLCHLCHVLPPLTRFDALASAIKSASSDSCSDFTDTVTGPPSPGHSDGARRSPLEAAVGGWVVESGQT